MMPSMKRSVKKRNWTLHLGVTEAKITICIECHNARTFGAAAVVSSKRWRVHAF